MGEGGKRLTEFYHIFLLCGKLLSRSIPLGSQDTVVLAPFSFVASAHGMDTDLQICVVCRRLMADQVVVFSETVTSGSMLVVCHKFLERVHHIVAFIFPRCDLEGL